MSRSACIPRSTDRFSPCTERGGIAPISAATTSPAGSTRLTIPQASASRAENRRPVSISSFARRAPTARGRICVPPAPGMMPSLISGSPNTASSAA